MPMYPTSGANVARCDLQVFPDWAVGERVFEWEDVDPPDDTELRIGETSWEGVTIGQQVTFDLPDLTDMIGQTWTLVDLDDDRPLIAGEVVRWADGAVSATAPAVKVVVGSNGATTVRSVPGVPGVDGTRGEPGPPGSGIDPLVLRRWHAAVSRGRGGGDPAIWACVGDSITEGFFGRPIDVVRGILAQYSEGWISAGWVPANPATASVRPHRFVFTAGSLGADDASNGRISDHGLDNHSILLASGSTLTTGKIVSTGPTVYGAAAIPALYTMDIHWTASPGGGDLRVDVSLDGSSWTTVATIDTDGATAPSKTTLGPLGLDAWVRVTAVGAAVIFDGAYFAGGGETIRVYNLGHSGHNHTHVTNASHAVHMAFLDPDLLTDAHGQNDYATATAAQFAARMIAYRDLILAENIDPSWVFVTNYGSSGRTDWPDYVAAATEAAADAEVGQVNMYQLLGSLTPSPGGPYDLGADGVHLNATGGQFYGRALVEAVQVRIADDGSLPLGGGRITGDLEVIGSTVIKTSGLSTATTASLVPLSTGVTGEGWAVKAGLETAPRATLGARDLLGRTYLALSSNGVTEREFAWICLGTSALLMFANGSAVPIVYGQGASRRIGTAKTSNYTLVAADHSEWIEANHASGINVQVPTNASVAFPIGTTIAIRQIGSGPATITAAGGVTLESRGGRTKTNGQWAEAWVTKRATDTWVISGDVTT